MRVMFLSCLAALLTPFALAEDTEFFAVSSFGSMLIDRGEQLAAGVNETTLGVERVIGPGLLFADVYRITPLGADEEAFAEEVDYTLGYALPLGRHELVMAASWLTYPGSGGTESLELAGELVLDAPLSPVLIHPANCTAGASTRLAASARSSPARARAGPITARNSGSSACSRAGPAFSGACAGRPAARTSSPTPSPAAPSHTIAATAFP